MADRTAAERQRRYRERKRAEKQQGAAATVTSAVTPPVTPDADDGPARPYGLRARGKRMWDQLVADTDPIEVVVLVEEICRVADRLDRLDAIVNGRDRAWLTLEVDDVGEVTVVVDKVLGESRQQQMAFKGLLSELRAMRGASAKSSGRGRAQTSSKGGAGVTDLAARIAARRGRPTG